MAVVRSGICWARLERTEWTAAPYDPGSGEAPLAPHPCPRTPLGPGRHLLSKHRPASAYGRYCTARALKAVNAAKDSRNGSGPPPTPPAPPQTL